MTIDKLKAKRAHYEELKRQILDIDYSEELKAAVEEFICKFKSEKEQYLQENITKVDNYLELIDELILEELAKEDDSISEDDIINFNSEV